MDKSTLYMKDHLVALIENELGWGKGSTWGNKDFEELSERILLKTNKRLSVTTLKRIWGRAEWVANPSTATLDILSEFVGYENWRSFVKANKKEPPQQKIAEKSKSAKIWIPLTVLILVGSLLGFFWKSDSSDDKKRVYKSEDFVFESRPVSQGIPNSVVFEYDATVAEVGAKIEIQQDWDSSKRMIINKSDSVATSIYYHPGFFKTKLVVDDTIVREDDVFITTNDWLGMIERDSIPFYIDSNEIFKEDRISITPETVSSYDLDARTSSVVVSLYQVKDFGELYTDNFELNAVLKNDFEEGVSACQPAQVLILYDGGAIGIPLAKKGCASKITLMTFEGFVNGKKNDLSNFGVDFTEFVDVKCVSKNKKLDIFINGHAAYQMTVPEPALKIMGIVIKFEGAGSVKNLTFKKEEELIYTTE